MLKRVQVIVIHYNVKIFGKFAPDFSIFLRLLEGTFIRKSLVKSELNGRLKGRIRGP